MYFASCPASPIIHLRVCAALRNDLYSRALEILFQQNSNFRDTDAGMLFCPPVALNSVTFESCDTQCKRATLEFVIV